MPFKGSVFSKCTCEHNYEIQVCIYNPYFEQMVGQIYPNELQFNKANSPDAEAPCLDLNLSITNGKVSSKIYDKRDDFNFEIVKFPFLMEMFLARSPSIGVYVQRKVRIGTIPELYLRIVRIPILSADSGIVIPELCRTILESRKGYLIDFCYNQALRKVGMGWTK